MSNSGAPPVRVSVAPNPNRRRAGSTSSFNSISEAIHDVSTYTDKQADLKLDNKDKEDRQGVDNHHNNDDDDEDEKYKSKGFINDLYTFKWMTSPGQYSTEQIRGVERREDETRREQR